MTIKVEVQVVFSIQFKILMKTVIQNWQIYLLN